MVKVTIVFKYTQNAIVFKTKTDYSEVVRKLGLAKRNVESFIAMDSVDGGVIFDPREVVGFAIEKI
jgi:hypothetical protein